MADKTITREDKPAEVPMPTVSLSEGKRVSQLIADKIADGTLFNSGILSNTELATHLRAVLAHAEQLEADNAALKQDQAMLNFIKDESLDLRCYAIDEDVGWETVQHHMGRPHQRIASRVFDDDPRKAIREAMERLKRDPYCTEPLHAA